MAGKIADHVGGDADRDQHDLRHLAQPQCDEQDRQDGDRRDHRDDRDDRPWRGADQWDHAQRDADDQRGKRGDGDGDAKPPPAGGRIGERGYLPGARVGLGEEAQRGADHRDEGRQDLVIGIGLGPGRRTTPRRSRGR